MKNLILTLLILFAITGCSSNESNKNIEPSLAVGQNISSLKLNDQHEKSHTINANTRKLIFAFNKEVGHTCNDFFATKKDNYLSENNAVFIADISEAPSLIRSFFIIPGLEDLKHTVLILDNKKMAQSYKAGQETDKIVVVELRNMMITNIQALSSTKELEELLVKTPLESIVDEAKKMGDIMKKMF